MSLDKLVNYWKVPKRWIFGLMLLVVLYHWAVMFNVQTAFNMNWKDLLNHWDSGWYTDIVRKGYNGQNFAFYPLYPLVITILTALLPGFIPPEIIGALISTFFFLIYGLLIAGLAAKNPSLNGPAKSLLPQSPLAWFFMLWSPASYIFQTHHTEATFLLLSVAVCWACEHRRFTLAAILAGLCSVTKNQGIFLAISVGFWWAYVTDDWRYRCRNFVLSGLISGGFFLCFLLYSYFKTGDITAFYSAQSHWRPEMTWTSYFKALWFGNSWQNTNIGSIERYVLFWLMVIAAIGVWKKHKPLGFYVALFVGVMPLSGEFVGTFRYSTVLWPVWFWFAEKLEALPKRWKALIIPIVALYLMYLNHQLTRNYALGRWAY